MSPENTEKKPGEALGQIVRNARKKKNLTQSECASLCGLGRRHLQKIEAGEVNPPLAFFTKISGVLDTRACYFLNSESLDSPLSEHGISCVSEILDLLPTPVFIATPKGDLIYRNAAFIKLFGASCMSLSDIFCQESDRKQIQDQVLPQVTGQYRVFDSDRSIQLAQITWSRLAPSPSRAPSAVLGVAVILLPSSIGNGT